MIEKEFNDRIYTKSTAKREKYTIFMLQNIGLFPLLDSATHVRMHFNELRAAPPPPTPGLLLLT